MTNGQIAEGLVLMFIGGAFFGAASCLIWLKKRPKDFGVIHIRDAKDRAGR